MNHPLTKRQRLAEFCSRVAALDAEQLTPAAAAQVLVAERQLPAGAAKAADTPDGGWSALFAGEPAATPLSGFIAAAERRGLASRALQFAARVLQPERTGSGGGWWVAAEVVAMLAVLLVYGIFVLPTFSGAMAALGGELPQLTQLVLNVLAPQSPWLWLLLAVLAVGVVWRVNPALLGPLAAPLQTLLLRVPAAGRRWQADAGDSLAGWLGFGGIATGDARVALQAAAAVSPGYGTRQAARQALQALERGSDLAAALAASPSVDRELRELVGAPGIMPADLEAALRSRWTAARTRPVPRLLWGVFHASIVAVIGTVVVALYLPIFRIGAVF